MKTCVIQYGRCPVVAGGLKGFSRIYSDVGVEPKKSHGMFDVFCCNAVWGELRIVLLERSIGLAIGE